jgi:3-methyladenine DNA glycosylase/8-oxoguanine DNA glycosylase
MRALGWPDAFPHTDLGIYKALGETRPKRVLEIAEAWRPWRSYAAMHLWKSLETNQEYEQRDPKIQIPKSKIPQETSL